MFPLILSLNPVFITLILADFHISDETMYQDSRCRMPLRTDCYFTGLSVSSFKQKLMHSRYTWQEHVSRVFFAACLSNFQHRFSVKLDKSWRKKTIQYKFWSFHHKNTGSLYYYYEKECNYFIFAKYNLQRNKRMSPFEGIKEWLCNFFACYLLLLEELLKSVFQITVSETRLVSSGGNSKRQLRKEWGISTSDGGYPEAVSWHDTMGIWC